MILVRKSYRNIIIEKVDNCGHIGGFYYGNFEIHVSDFGMSAPATNNEINFDAAFGNQNQPGNFCSIIGNMALFFHHLTVLQHFLAWLTEVKFVTALIKNVFFSVCE
jgi:hypothetical protein